MTPQDPLADAVVPASGAPATPAAASGPPKARVDGWTCASCHALNPLAALACTRCEARLNGEERVSVAGLGMSSREWSTLLLAPLWVFFSVAGADGWVDDPELAALRRLEARRIGWDDPLLLAILGGLRSDFWGVVERHGLDGRSVGQGLADVRALLALRVDAERGLRVRAALLRLGVAVARASSGRPLGLGRRIHPEETRVLASIAGSLGLSGDEMRASLLPAVPPAEHA